MRRYFSSLAPLLLSLLLASPAHAGPSFHCDASTGVPVLNADPTTAQDQFFAAQTFNSTSFCKTADHAKALEWYGKAAQQGHKEAAFQAGEMYFTGLGIPVNYPEAKKWYLVAANQGQGEAELRLGFLFAEKHFEGLTADLGEAEKWFTKAAEQDVKDARFRLGNFYLNYKTPPDIPKALLWLQKGAEGGHITAMYDLGRLLVQQKETAKGIEWITKAAEADDMQAQMTLTEIYQTGREVPRDDDAVMKWTLRVTTHPAAPVFYLTKAGDMFFDGTPNTPRNYPAARRLYERAAALNDPYAMRQLADIYKRGLGTKKDEARAQKLNDRAARIELLGRPK